jgi:A/G-specific adenine glycosylase
VLLGWYRRNARRLPWREETSPYRTVVSEFMLQQTRVSTVIPYFERWMEELPDWSALAAAPEKSVLKLWEGLGYYSRALRLRQLARQLVALPKVPRSREEWLKLPGVGPYTAAAIASIAFGEPAACVDGNVVRILARLVADGTGFRDGVAAARAFSPLAERLIIGAAPGDHNQAMMELGATVCTKDRPRCTECPVRRFCAAEKGSRPADYPRIEPRRIEVLAVTRVWCERGGALLLHRSGRAAQRLAGQHELPTAGQAGLQAEEVEKGTLIARRRRGITRFRITESIYAAEPPCKRLADGLVWMALADLDSVVLSGPHRRWISEILRNRKHLEPAL